MLYELCKLKILLKYHFKVNFSILLFTPNIVINNKRIISKKDPNNFKAITHFSLHNLQFPFKPKYPLLWSQTKQLGPTLPYMQLLFLEQHHLS